MGFAKHKKMVGIYLSPDLIPQLAETAQLTGLSQSQLVERVLREALPQLRRHPGR